MLFVRPYVNLPFVVFNRYDVRGFASNVLSCPERERLEEQSRMAEKRDSAKVHGVVNSTLRYVPGGSFAAALYEVGPKRREIPRFARNDGSAGFPPLT